MSSNRLTGAIKCFSFAAGMALASVSHAQSGAGGPPLEDGQAAFEKRQDTMKRMGRPFYLGIGRVVKGKTPYGPDTVAAAETVAAVAKSLDWGLFPPGSDVERSRMRPEILAAKERVEELIAAVQKATASLVPVVAAGDKAAIAAAYGAVADACEACHKQFRKEE